MKGGSEPQNDQPAYLAGAGLGLCAGFIELKFADLLLTALFVLASTMLLGAIRRQRPWRWTLIVAVFVPLLQFGAYVLRTQQPYRAQIYESFLGVLTGIAGAYSGALGRSAFDVLFRPDSSSN
jgi:energy-converting hydrogenase Eha subunit A